MGCFLTNSSLGKKLVMSITGCFLVLFILFHMSMNIVAIFSPEAYNTVCASHRSARSAQRHGHAPHCSPPPGILPWLSGSEPQAQRK